VLGGFNKGNFLSGEFTLPKITMSLIRDKKSFPTLFLALLESKELCVVFSVFSTPRLPLISYATY